MKSENGFGITETIVALAILSVLVLGVAESMKNIQDSLRATRITSSRDTLRNLLDRYIGDPSALQKSSTHPQNSALRCCILTGQEAINAGCNPPSCDETEKDLALLSPTGSVMSGVQAQPAIFDQSGGPCPVGASAVQCPIQAFTKFKASCGGTSPCESAKTITVTYWMKVNPGIQIPLLPTLREFTRETTTAVPFRISNTGAVDKLAKWTSNTDLNHSEVYEDPRTMHIGIGTQMVPPFSRLHIQDTAAASTYYQWPDGSAQSVIASFRGGNLESPTDGRKRARVVIDGLEGAAPSLDLRLDDRSGLNHGAHLYLTPADYWNSGDPETFGIYMGALGSTALAITPSNGHVGIGTLRPNARLEVNGNGAFNNTATGQFGFLSIAGKGDSSLISVINLADLNGPSIWGIQHRKDGNLVIGNGIADSVSFFLDPTGRVGIGVKPEPLSNLRLDVIGNAKVSEKLTTQSLIVNSLAEMNNITPQGGTLTVSGKVNVTGRIRANFVVPSDLRLKTQIRVIEDCLKKVLALRGVTYQMNQQESFGLIAQEVMKIFPEIVDEDSEGYLSLDYSRLTVPLIEALKSIYQIQISQSAQIIELRNKIRKLESKTEGP